MVENDIRINAYYNYYSSKLTGQRGEVEVERFIENNYNKNNESTKSDSSIKVGNSNSSISTTSCDDDNVDVHVVTTALKYFFKNCKEKCIPKLFNDKFLKANRIENELEKLIKINKLLIKMPEINFRALKMLMSHFYNVSLANVNNSMTISKLSEASHFLYDATDNLTYDSKTIFDSFSQIFEHLIRYHDVIFENNFKEIVKNYVDHNNNFEISNSNDSVYKFDSRNYILDDKGVEFIQECITMIEERIIHDDIYRKGGNIFKAIQFVRNNYESKYKNKQTNGLKENESNISIINDIDDITSALKYFLRNCNETLIPKINTDDFLKANRIMNETEKLKEINKLLLKIPEINLKVLKILMSHLFKVSCSEHVYKMKISNLLTSFHQIFDFNYNDNDIAKFKPYHEICELLIKNHDKIFEHNFEEIVKSNPK